MAQRKEDKEEKPYPHGTIFKEEIRDPVAKRTYVEQETSCTCLFMNMCVNTFSCLQRWRSSLVGLHLSCVCVSICVDLHVCPYACACVFPYAGTFTLVFPYLSVYNCMSSHAYISMHIHFLTHAFPLVYTSARMC